MNNNDSIVNVLPCIIKQWTGADKFRKVGNRNGIVKQIFKSYGQMKNATRKSHNITVVLSNEFDEYTNPIGFFQSKLQRDLAYELIRTNKVEGAEIELDWKTFFKMYKKPQVKQNLKDIILPDLPLFSNTPAEPGLLDFLIENGEVNKSNLAIYNKHEWCHAPLTERLVTQLATTGQLPYEVNPYKFALTLCLMFQNQRIQGYPLPVALPIVLSQTPSG